MLDNQVIEMAEYNVLADIGDANASSAAGANAANASNGTGALAAAREMALDGQTVQNLELLFNATDGRRSGSLLALLDRTSTPFGKRLLPRWVSEPPCALSMILERQAAVRAFSECATLASAVERALSKLPDIERLLARVKALTMKPKELLRLLSGLEDACAVWQCVADCADDFKPLRGAGGELLQSMAAAAVAKKIPIAGVVEQISAEFDVKALRESEVLVPNEGVDDAFDTCREAMKALEERLQEQRNQVSQQFNRFLFSLFYFLFSVFVVWFFFCFCCCCRLCDVCNF